ncbi:hypothetical protein [Qipengyuania gaetbuli]|uniref:hypothetical protein n=1 Tax=Qipengyuania gaetbuli TaxID=266952 RepID=UPI001CD715EA|nr:hypothetical protein [Qipengyuania gaetbuli]MCA0910074.1 hypothetical protein [Qipengyuania gaetbuli]
MRTQWHRSEPKTLRPFFAVRSVEETTHHAAIKIAENAASVEDEVIDVDEIDLRQLQISIKPNIVASDEWLPAGFAADDLELAIFCRSPFLKNSIIVGTYSLEQPMPEEVSVSDEILQKLGGGRELRITVALVLVADKERQAGMPFSMGHWLSSKTFHLRERKLQTMFDVKTRTSEEWVEANYPPKTLYSVVYIGGIDAAGDENGPIADVHIHLDAYNRMAGEKIGETLEPMLSVEMIAQVLEQSLADWRDYDEAPPGSPLLNLTKKITNADKPSLAELKKIVTNQSLLRAVLQDKIGVLSYVTSGGN